MKQFKYRLCMLGLVLLLASCASTPGDADSDTGDAGSEIASESNKLGNGDIEASTENPTDSALDSEEEIAGGQEAAADAAPVEANNTSIEDEFQGDFADEKPLEQDLAKPNEPAITEELPADMPEPVMADEPMQNTDDNLTPTDRPINITALSYKSNENGGTIVIQADGIPQYTTQENANQNQFVLEIENAILPKKFQRPYNTKEFSGPIGIINAYQAPGSTRARVVVQLKSSTAMSVVQEGNSLLLVPGAAVAQMTPEPTVEQSVSAPEEPAVDANTPNDQALATKTLDEFLVGDVKYYGRKISVEIADGEVRDVVNFISEESGVNLILSDEVKGKISVKLRQIPWDQALVLIMQTKQLGYIRQGNVLRIAPLTAIRMEADSARQLMESQKLLEPLRVKIFPVSYSKAKDLETQATGFLSSRGSAKADERTNSLVVKDIAENVLKIQKLVHNLDTQTPQVYIEGRIVETRSSMVRKIGINWRTLTESTGTIAYGLASKTLDPGGVIGLEAKLDLLETEEKVKVLSAPKIVTLNNQVATIEQISQFPIYNETVDSQTGKVTRSVDFKPIKLNLNVTPQITADGGVILKTELLREFAGAVDQFAGTTGARSINTRSAKTTILVDNGQTAILGGIYQSDNTKSNSGLPLLRKIPLLGWLFGQDNDNEEKNELLIFLTPRILNKDKAFQVSEGVDESSNL